MKTYLQIIFIVDFKNRAKLYDLFLTDKLPFIKKKKGTISYEILISEDDIQILHCFNNKNNAIIYLQSDSFIKNVLKQIKNLSESNPKIKIYDCL